MPNDFLDNFVGTANQQCSLRAKLCIESRAGGSRPSALLGNRRDGAGIAGKEIIGRLLGRLCDVAGAVPQPANICRDLPRIAMRDGG